MATVRSVFGGLKSLVRAFVVEHRGVVSVVDTGQEGSLGRILAGLEALDHEPGDVRQIVLTHCHGDHTGDAARLKEATGAVVVAGAADAPAIDGTGAYPGPVDHLFGWVYRDLARFPRLAVDRQVIAREELDGGIVAIPTPGHTAGHISVLIPDLSAVLVGDAVWHLGPVRPSWRRLTQDPARNAESIRELAALRADRILPSHGGEIPPRRLQELAKPTPW